VGMSHRCGGEKNTHGGGGGFRQSRCHRSSSVSMQGGGVIL